jgi:hypothetical protein
MGYPTEVLDSNRDDGTMPDNVAELASYVVGHRIVSAENVDVGLVLTLDDGTTVTMVDSSDCCAYTALDRFLLDPAAVDHIITGVGTTSAAPVVVASCEARP